MSKNSMPAGDLAGLPARFTQLQDKAFARAGRRFPIMTIQEAGLDGFWIHRALLAEEIESHVVDATSIATSRRRRRAKTDKIDGEALIQALLAYNGGEPRVCAMVKAPTPEEEDRRRLCREPKVLIIERVRHVNRIKGLLFSQGITGYQPLRRDRRGRLEELQPGDSHQLPSHLKAQLSRELDRLEMLLAQIKTVEAERDARLAAETGNGPGPTAMLLRIKEIGPEFASALHSEGLFRNSNYRRSVRFLRRPRDSSTAVVVKPKTAVRAYLRISARRSRRVFLDPYRSWKSLSGGTRRCSDLNLAGCRNDHSNGNSSQAATVAAATAPAGAAAAFRRETTATPFDKQLRVIWPIGKLHTEAHKKLKR